MHLCSYVLAMCCMCAAVLGTWFLAGLFNVHWILVIYIVASESYSCMHFASRWLYALAQLAVCFFSSWLTSQMSWLELLNEPSRAWLSARSGNEPSWAACYHNELARAEPSQAGSIARLTYTLDYADAGDSKVSQPVSHDEGEQLARLAGCTQVFDEAG